MARARKAAVGQLMPSQVQATVVYIVTLMQGWGPPSSILPGIDRFVGILCGVIILLLVSLLWWPLDETQHTPTDPTTR